MDASESYLVLLKPMEQGKKNPEELFNKMHINEFHTQDCPQSWSLLFLLFAHQLPEIIMKILISILLFYLKEKQSFLYNMTFTLYHLSHSITLHNTDHWPRLAHLSSLSLFSCLPRFSSIPPFSFWTLWEQRWITRSRYKVFNHTLHIRNPTIRYIWLTVPVCLQIQESQESPSLPVNILHFSG